MRSRPTTLLGMLWRLATLKARQIAAVALAVVAVAVGVAVVSAASSARSPADSAPLRVASFNIEFFPQNDRQVSEAFRVIETLEVSAIGVQEIIDARRFAREARARLGDSWQFVHQSGVGGPRRKLHIGVLYDSRAFELEGATSRRGTRVDDRSQPTFQVDLRERRSGRTITLLVVHFKAMSSGRETRARQYVGLRSIVREVRASEPNVVVMGDFNATELGDRADLRELGGRTGLVWATEDLPCSAFWERAEDCPTSRLDHALTWRAPSLVEARGGCEAGCDARDRCPLYRRVVSDHCPVVVELAD